MSRSVNLAGGLSSGLVIDNGTYRAANVSGGVLLIETGVLPFTAALAETMAASDVFGAGTVTGAVVAETVAVTDALIGGQMIITVPGAQGDCSLTVIVPGSSA
jgi:hypothetical protein